MEFKDLGLSNEALEALARKGFTSPTPIQEKAIPLLLAGEKDIIGQAATGTGKTAAFGLPVLECTREACGTVQAIILTPTRELAIQITDEMESLKGRRRIRLLTVYGGQPIHRQLMGLRQGVEIVVGTPGRVMDHLERGSLKLDDINFFILDEADEMCNMGFIDDVRSILERAGTNRRTMLFSATMPPEIKNIATEFMGPHEVISVMPENNRTALENQIFHEVGERDRFETLCRVIDQDPDFYGLVFCRTRQDTAEIADMLGERGYPAEALHGEISQNQREEILERFRKRRINVLVATDVAARGIDVPELTHVVNLGLPQSPETYVHRIGRTGRAGRSGTAVTIITSREFRKFTWLARAAKADVKKMQLPSVNEVVTAKKQRLAADLDRVIEEHGNARHKAFAAELLENRDASEVVASLLEMAVGGQFDPSNYREIQDVHQKQQMGGRVKLKAEMGRAQGMHPRKFVDLICKNANVPPLAIQQVRIMGRHSTFTAPAQHAQKIMRAMNRGGRPVINRI